MLSTLGEKFIVKHFHDIGIFFLFLQDVKNLFFGEKYHQPVVISRMSPESDKG